MEGEFVAVLRGHTVAVSRLAWSADSRLLVSASRDNAPKLRFCSLFGSSNESD